MAGKLYLIDSYSQIFRAFHALPELNNAEGLPTNAVYGFTTMLRKLLQEEKPDYVVAVFDSPGRKQRHEDYAGYKASRPETPQDLRVQIPWVKKVCEALRIPVLENADHEADDIIGTLARKAEQAGLQTMIVSEDKDLLQLVNDKVALLSERNERHVYDAAEVERKYGVPPTQIADLLGLMGDSVDDIPGVPGIGAKRAVELLQRYGSLEEAVANAADLERYQYGRNLAEFAEQARLSKRLATVHTDLDIDIDLDAMRLQEPDRTACRDLFTRLEFKRLIDDYAEAPTAAECACVVVEDADQLIALVARLRESGRIAVVLLTEHADPMRAVLVGVAMTAGGEGHYVAIGHQGLGERNALRAPEFARIAGDLLRDGKVQIAGHDLKRSLIVLQRQGIADVHPWMDIMLASYVLHPTRESHALGPLALEQLRVQLPEAAEILPDKKVGFENVPVAEAGGWAVARAEIVLRLAASMDAELVAQPGLSKLLHDIEMPLMEVLAGMERRGVRIDTPYLQELSRELGTEIDRLEHQIHEEAGGPFNINSPKQLGEVLFDRLELPVGGRTAKSGERSTKAEVLEALAAEHDIARHILEYRELTKLKSTYLDALPGFVNPETGRVHASFDQAVAATGRLSSSNPNLQNIPVRSATGKRIRRAFIPADGHVLLTADYSQIELRIMAHLSGDQALRRAFREGVDIHRATAAEIFQVAPDDVTSQQRDRAKVINFGVLYGMGPQRLAREFGVSLKEAKDFIERYLGAFPKVQEFLEETVHRAREQGFVTTLLGRVRHLPELQSGRPMIRSFGERVAVNTPLQGFAADLIKAAMVNLDRRLRREHMHSAMIIQVHDELVLEVPESEQRRAARIVKEEMEGAFPLDVPLVVEVGIGPNWMEAKG